ncbi:hypothetical protein E3E12_08315 [Formicincola oecophyllae]|uniref:LapA family protein n=1 Tax=Formicincola oecophyllae TaxID=2558361 RepID=A0A4Y6UCS3_9PROT|nr:hypothetical protein [Formicincola oecophyllae]QDH14191.1 hypothetical protein E3E12_08315 [Formicincola oecophyllae]
MVRLFIIVLYLAALAMFAISNMQPNPADPTAIYLAGTLGEFHASAGMLAGCVGVAGLVLGLILGAMGQFKDWRKGRGIEKKLREVEKDNARLQGLVAQHALNNSTAQAAAVTTADGRDEPQLTAK